MLSRTSARQQRMRQQTLNEERIAQDQLGPRTSNECRSKGSKLIISSPTTTSHPSLNILLSGSQAPTQHIDDTSKLSSQYNRGFGASALLASLNASGQQYQNTATHPTRFFLSQEDSQSMVSSVLQEKSNQQLNSSVDNCKSSLITSNASANAPANQHSVDSRNSIHLMTAANTSNATSTTNTTITGNSGINATNKAVSQTVPMHFTEHSSAQRHVQSHLHSKHSSFDGTSPNTQIKSNSELSVLEMGSNDSPTPSDMNSPVESCFANIMEDQGSDSFDLNNITPSINLSSSVGVSDSTIDFSHQTTDSSERLQQSVTTTMPIVTNKLDSLAQISPMDINSIFRKENTKSNRDEACMKVSSSCPAVVPEDLQHMLDSTSPVQSGSRAPQSVLSESGSSPSGCMNNSSETAGIPMNHGSSGVGNLSSSAGNRSADDQRVAWIKDRTKKDSHNRIERKRRDYINCQIAELGSLLPEDMFRDGDGKKNKGNILKNSVEFICLLRSELAQIPEVRRETSLAAKVIGQLVKRIQELESITNMSSSQQHNSRSNSDYQSLLQEWVMLHENNLQNSMSIGTNSSPVTRHSFPQTDTAGSSSPGLSSVGTEEMINSDTKVAFSNSVPVPIVGSAPVPSNPLGSCSRMNSPISNMNLVSRPTAGSAVTDSPLRLMRTRCTSLTVSTIGANSFSGDGNMPGGGSSTSSGIRLHGSEYQSQANRLRSQRVLQQPHQSPQLRIFQPNNQSGMTSQGALRNSQFQSKHIPQNHYPSSSLSPQHHFNMQRQVIPSPSGLAGGSNRSQELNNSSHCLSASLPVNVNPLLCGLQDPDISDITDDKCSQMYLFDSSSSFIPQLKSEPICETDSAYNAMHSLGLDLCHGNTGNTILEPVTQFDPIIASVVQTAQHHPQQHRQQHHHHQQQQSQATHHQHPTHQYYHHQQQQHQYHHHQQQQHPSLNHPGIPSSKTLDSSTPPIGLDIDDFQFDDVPME